MKFWKVPYPKASFGYYSSVLLIIALVVVFILVVFQPFGTSSFVHSNKNLILVGYGLVIFALGILFFILTEYFIPTQMKDRWTILHEVSFLFANVMLGVIGCYLYNSYLFSNQIQFSGFWVFLFYAGSVAIIPVSVYLFFIYFQYKEISHLSQQKEVEQTQDYADMIELTGTNTKERIQLKPDDLLFIKSNDNYVILYFLEEGNLTKKMMRNTLNHIEKMTSNILKKCHRSYLVNPSKILNIEGNKTNSKLIIKGADVKVPVSRSFIEAFREMNVSG